MPEKTHQPPKESRPELRSVMFVRLLVGVTLLVGMLPASVLTFLMVCDEVTNAYMSKPGRTVDDFPAASAQGTLVGWIVAPVVFMVLLTCGILVLRAKWR